MYKIHKWFDTLPEPRRFLTFFIPASILIGFAMGGPEPYNGFASLLLLTALLSRAWYIHIGKKEG